MLVRCEGRGPEIAMLTTPPRYSMNSKIYILLALYFYLFFILFYQHISPISRTRGHSRCKERTIIPYISITHQGKPKKKQKVLDGFRMIAQSPDPQHTKKRHTSRCVTGTAIMREGRSDYKLKTSPSTKLPLLLLLLYPLLHAV